MVFADMVVAGDGSGDVRGIRIVEEVVDGGEDKGGGKVDTKEDRRVSQLDSTLR